MYRSIELGTSGREDITFYNLVQSELVLDAKRAFLEPRFKIAEDLSAHDMEFRM